MSLSYDLSKELTDAGFPRRLHGHDRGLGHVDYINVADNETKVYHPTLEELIEACGTAFASLNYSSGIFSQRTEDKLAWIANGYNDGSITQHIEATPIEAVARLWLTLKTPHGH